MQPTGCKATKNELLNKFLKGLQKIPEKIQEKLRFFLVHYRNKNYSSALRVFNIPEILETTSAVEFLSVAAGTNRFSTE